MENEKITAVLNEVMVNKLESIAFDIKYYINTNAGIAQSLYSHKELNNKNCDQLQEMIFQKGINWNDYPSKYKRGRIIGKETYIKDNTNRSKWTNINNNEIPIFTQEREFITNLIPKI